MQGVVYKIRQSENAYRRLQEFVNTLKPGQVIKYVVNYNAKRERKWWRKNKGRIVKTTSHYILIQTEHYKECINILDFFAGDVKIVLG